MTRPTAIAFTGRLGSGKSTLAQAVAATLGWPSASFGAYLREAAVERGLPNTREVLQELGTAFIERVGFDNFGRLVLSAGGWTPGRPVVVEGVRHLALLPVLSTLVAPLRLWHVHVQTSDQIRLARLKERGTGEEERLITIESHSTETDILTGGLQAVANLVIDASQPVETLVTIVLGSLS